MRLEGGPAPSTLDHDRLAIAPEQQGGEAVHHSAGPPPSRIRSLLAGDVLSVTMSARTTIL